MYVYLQLLMLMLSINLCFESGQRSFDTTFDPDVYARLGQQDLDVLLRDICLSMVGASYIFSLYLHLLIYAVTKLLSISGVAAERRSRALASGRYPASRRLCFQVKAYVCTCSHAESTTEVVGMNTTSSSDGT